MDSNLKQEWITALKSGEYNQGRGYLCDMNTDGSKEFCCLGVLGDLLHKKDPARFHWENESDSIQTFVDGNLDEMEYLPLSTRQFVGLNIGEVCMLANMNDGTNGQTEHSFREIADYIQESI